MDIASITSRRAGRQRSQALVEFSLVAPILLLTAFVAIDLGRLVFTWSAISDASSEGARTLTLASEQTSDCLTLQRTIGIAQGFNLGGDPNSMAGNSDPNGSGSPGPSTPPPSRGYVYLWPAVATSAPVVSNCAGSAPRLAGGNKDVSVEVDYDFVPLTPIPHVDLVIKSISRAQTEY